MTSTYEIRDPDDEIVAHNVDVHIERMDDGTVWMAIYPPEGQRFPDCGRIVAWFTAKRVKMTVRKE